jgi:signal transduction histidine kinase
MIKTQNSFRRSGVALLLVGSLILAADIGATFWVGTAERRCNETMNGAFETKTRLLRLLSLLQDAETGQRGYLLTRDESYLEPYDQATREISGEFSGLRSNFVTELKQVQNIDLLKSIIDAKFAELGTTIELKRAAKDSEALSLVRSGEGKALMDRGREIVAAMMAEQENAIIDSRADLRWRSLWFRIGIISSIVLFLAFAALNLFYAFRRAIDLVVSRDALASANEQLVNAALAREKLEGQLRHAQKMEAIGQLTGGLAHDFNNMLSVVISSMELLKRRLSRGDKNVDTFIDSALDAAHHAAKLTHRLLAFARRQPLSPTPIDANKFVANISDILRRTLGEHIELETILNAKLWLTHVDTSELESAILNLAVNARDAMTEGGRLTIETANCQLDDTYGDAAGIPAGQYVMIAVTDTGYGMSEDAISQAFEPFFTTKGVGKGTGLGLSQVYGFVKQSGGHAKLYSELGIGTTVKLYLPRYFGDIKADAVTNVSAQRPARVESNETILVVEDEERTRLITVASLRELGYTVLHADGAMAALRIIDAHAEISLLFTDIVMPEINGRNLADEAQKRRPDLKVLFTTGYTRNAIVHNGVLDPDVQLISKPFSLEQLARKLREILGTS